MTLEKVCSLADKCKIAGTAACMPTCFPYILAHGANGAGGVFSASGLPGKYRNRWLTNIDLIKDQNPIPHSVVTNYTADILKHVRQGIGFFFYSVPNKENPRGTGTGKSTAAATLINEYIRARVIEQATGGRPMGDKQPGLYVRMSEFQNVYNSQFRGPGAMQEEAALKYYAMKRAMMDAELLVLDDIGLRDAKTLVNEVYEIVDHRNNQDEIATIFTSNLPVNMLRELLSDQIVSRIQEMTEEIPFKGQDNRKKFM